MATQAQYDAAAAALHSLANAMIAKLGMFERTAAQNALNDTVVRQFAKAAVDASEKAGQVSKQP
jgi:hypothetical protein